MKKIFFGIVALVAMVATSCQQSLDELNVVGGSDAAVTFNVGAGSRAYSDGKTATHLQWAVYDAAGNLLPALQGEKTDFQISTTVEFQLTTGNTYYVLFWATAPNAPYTVDWAAKSMTVNYTGAKSNEETRDAFYKYHEFTVSGSQTETVELKRPFAQLNIGTSDLEASEKAGHKVTHAMVEVTAYEKLNFATGAVENEAVRTFAYEAIPGTSEVFPVNDAENDYLAMNYLLMSSTKETFDVTFTYSTDATGANAKSRIVGSVPFQRNHRTNLYGQLLTSDVAVNVEIKPEYDDPMHEPSELQLAAAFGGEVTLTEDVVLTSPLEVSANLTINLNGRTISANNNSGYAIKNIGGGTLHITDTGNGVVNGVVYNENNGHIIVDGGTFNAADGGTYVFLNSGGTLTVNGGTVNGGSSYPLYSYDPNSKLVINDVTVNGTFGCINAYTTGGEVKINGGTFTMTGVQGKTSHIAYFSNVDVTINGGTFKKSGDINMSAVGGGGVCVIYGAQLTVNGGEFAGDYADIYNWSGTNANGRACSISILGGTYKFKPTAAWIADGYKAIENGGKYYVVADSIDAVASNSAELSAALENGENVVLTGDVAYGTKITNDATIALNGNTFEATNTIKLENNTDFTMTGGDYVVNGTHGHLDIRPSTAEGSTIYYEDVNFAFNQLGKTYGPSTNRLGSIVEVCAAAADAHTKITFKNCTFDNAQVVFEGMSGKTGTFEAVFEGCTFNALTSSAPIYVQNYVKGIIKVVDCTFNLTCTSSSASAVSVSSSTSTGVTVTAENNTLNAIAATPYTYDASKGETEVHNVKVNGTPQNIKFVSWSGTTSTVIENGTVKSGIAL